MPSAVVLSVHLKNLLTEIQKVIVVTHEHSLDHKSSLNIIIIKKKILKKNLWLEQLCSCIATITSCCSEKFLKQKEMKYDQR